MLVVNPNHRLRNNLAAVELPLWAALIAAHHHTKLLDTEVYDMSLDRAEKCIRETKQRRVLIVVMGNNPSVSSTPKMPAAEALAERIKDLQVWFTGIHPIAVNYKKYHVIKEPFKDFPIIQWDDLPLNWYIAHNWHCLDGSPRSPYASVYTSLGCPFNCYFCNIHTLYGNRQVQFRPIDDILWEVERLNYKYKVRNIKIWDELFALKEDRVISICSGLKGLDLNIWAYARIDTVTEKMLRAMRDGGIKWLAYGFESIKDPKFVPQTERVIEMTKDAGISIIGNFMFGMPNTTPEDDKLSLDFAKRHLFEFVNFYVARPYPGSEWYNDIRPTMTWEQYDQYGGNRMSFRDNAFVEYFTNPAYLEMIGKKFGKQAIKKIEDMLRQGVHYAKV